MKAPTNLNPQELEAWNDTPITVQILEDEFLNGNHNQHVQSVEDLMYALEYSYWEALKEERTKNLVGYVLPKFNDAPSTNDEAFVTYLGELYGDTITRQFLITEMSGCYEADSEDDEDEE